ncbi:MAG: DUF2723 domain-containing protein, partial [Gemmatimonadetes bacterium]|nr:DUF2723 domain-containing protein [Gemmatimonadota bacterium]
MNPSATEGRTVPDRRRESIFSGGQMDLTGMLQRRRANKTGSEDGPPYLWAGVVALAIGILYAVTLSPSTAFWDASEYIATAHILGIPHPPGNPLFVVMA